MHKLAIAAVAALPFLFAADQTAPPRVTVPIGAPRYSQERLDRLRRSLAAQIAVRDAAERAMRAPTAAEAAALALAPSATTLRTTARAIALPRGGVALRADGSNLSLAVAEQNADGAVRITHDASSGVSTQTGAASDR